MLATPKSDRPEVAYDQAMVPVVLESGSLHPLDLLRRFRGISDGLREVGTLADVLETRPDARVEIQRQGGLGDVVLLLPALRAMQARFPAARWKIATRYPELFAMDPTIRTSGGADLRVALDGFLELDHTGDPRFSHVSRVELYAKVLGVALESASWHLPISTGDRELARRLVPDAERMTVALQLRGAAPQRTLGPQLLAGLIDSLRQQYRLVLLDADRGVGPSGEGILNLSGQVNVRQVVATLERCDAVVTMESGIFWMAHVAKVPTVCFFGPTRPEERLGHHPLYPDGVRAVVMNGLIEPHCPPCWGNGSTCNAWSRGAARCLSDPDPKLIADLVHRAVCEVTRRTP